MNFKLLYSALGPYDEGRVRNQIIISSNKAADVISNIVRELGVGERTPGKPFQITSLEKLFPHEAQNLKISNFI